MDSRKLAEVLADYDAVVAEWRAVNARADEEGEAPTVREAEDYSDGLERVAHAFAAVMRTPFAEGGGGRPAAQEGGSDFPPQTFPV